MNSGSSSLRTILALTFFLGLATTGALLADSETKTSGGIAPQPMLDNDERMQLDKARQQVLATDPELKTETEHLKSLHDSAANQNPPASPEQRNAMFAEWKAYQKKMRAAMLQVDPTLGPLFAKIDHARKNGAAAPFSPPTAK
jgi:hypothetical protein